MTYITLQKFDSELLFTDTDNLTHEIKSEDVYEEFSKCKHLFDFSKYQSKSFDLTNKKFIGKMKGVNRRKPINEFIGLKSIMHCILSDGGKETNTAKGVNITMEFN